MLRVEPIEWGNDLRLGRQSADRVEEQHQIGAEPGRDEERVQVVERRLLIGREWPGNSAPMLMS